MTRVFQHTASEAIDDRQRRTWLLRAAGLTTAGIALQTLAPARLAFAAGSSGSGQLVVVMLRGALDGLAAVSPIGDPNWTTLRPPAEERGASPAALVLDTTFALHPQLGTLHDWFRRGELLVAHAIASPYRERSHFDAQQLLESGGTRPYQFTTGWLGRALQMQNGAGIALNEALPVALRGAERASTWTPERDGISTDTDLAARLMPMYASDPMLARAFAQAMEQQGMRTGDMAAASGRGAFAQLARQAGSFLSAANGPRVAWLELGGWDTHNQQVNRLNRALETLDQGLAALKLALGSHWADTTVLVMSEFGRSAAYNGTNGTDHGTGGVAFVAGGAVAGGRVLSDWPGLARNQLHEGRDLKPTRDIRSLIRPLVERHLGISTTQLEQDILPGSPVGYTDIWRT